MCACRSFNHCMHASAHSFLIEPACLPVPCLPACLPACPPACPPACLLVPCLPACVPACLPACLRAKRRRCNDAYVGTLSSYAYVLMCIAHLQCRSPPVLPVLQEMNPTHRRTIGECQCVCGFSRHTVYMPSRFCYYDVSALHHWWVTHITAPPCVPSSVSQWTPV
jgi:hypothetical protein